MAKTSPHLTHLWQHWWRHHMRLVLLILGIMAATMWLLPIIWMPVVQYPGRQFVVNDHSRTVEDSDVQPYGTLVATLTGNQVLFWRVDHPQQIQERWSLSSANPRVGPASVRWSRDGTLLVVAYLDGDTMSRVDIWNYKRHQLLASYIDHDAALKPLAMHPTKPLLAISTKHTILLWNWETDTRLPLPAPDTIQQSLAFSADGHWLASEAYVFDLLQPTAPPQSLRQLGFQGTTIAMHPTKPLLFIGRGGRIIQVNLATKVLEQQVTAFDHPISSMVVSPDGALLAIGQGWREFSGDSAPDVQIRHVADLSFVSTFHAQGRGAVNRLAFTGENRYILVQAKDFNHNTALYNDDSIWIMSIP